MLLWFVAGIAVGWVVEFIIDWSFWRRAASAPQATDIASINDLAVLRRKVKDYEVRIHELQTLLNQASASIGSSTEPSSSKE